MHTHYFAWTTIKQCATFIKKFFYFEFILIKQYLYFYFIICLEGQSASGLHYWQEYIAYRSFLYLFCFIQLLVYLAFQSCLLLIIEKCFVLQYLLVAVIVEKLLLEGVYVGDALLRAIDIGLPDTVKTICEFADSKEVGLNSFQKSQSLHTLWIYLKGIL